MLRNTLLVAAAIIATVATDATAQSFTFSTNDSQILPGTANQGLWNTGLIVADTSTWTRAGYWYVPAPTNPLITPGLAELRSFFSFDLAGLNLDGQLPASAILRMPHGTVPSASGSETLGFYQVTTDARRLNTQGIPTPADIFTDLGDGPQYATFTFVRGSDPTAPVDINLDGAALQDILSASGRGFFSIGMSMLPSSYSGDPRTGGVSIISGPGAFIEAGADSGRDGVTPTFPAARLIVTPVPEPGTWAMLLLGFAAVGTAIRRARRLSARRTQTA